MIETIVDFSTTIGPARNQHAREMCLAFASSDFNMYQNSATHPLSVEYLAHHAVAAIPNWAPGDGLNIQAVGVALASPGQPWEDAYPYVKNQQDQPFQAPPSGVGKLFTCAIQRPSFTPQTIIAELQAKKPICLGMAMNDEWYDVAGGIINYSSAYTDDLHAVLAVGVGIHHLTNEHHVLIRNSWGSKWAQNGHAWLPERYLSTHLVALYTG